MRVLRKIAILLFAFCLLLPVSVAAQGPAPLSVDDEIQRISPSSTVISPDGQWVLFVRSDLNWKKNKRETRLYRASADGGEPIRFTHGPADRDPRWSPDGRTISFIRATAAAEEEGGKRDEKKSQLWVMSAFGGEASQLTKHSEGVRRYVWSPGSDGIVFIANNPKSKEDKKRLKDGDDAFAVFDGPNGQGKASWSNIWTIDLEEKKSRQVTKEKMLVSDLDISPEGKRVAFIYRTENSRNRGNLAEVGLARLDDGKLVRLTENLAPESRVRWHPNGREIGYLAPDDKNWELRQAKLYLMDVESRKHRLISSSIEVNIGDYVFAADKARILFSGGVSTNRQLFAMDISTSKVTPLMEKAGVVGRGVTFSQDGKRAAFTWSDLRTPSDVYVADLPAGAQTRRLSDLNPQIRERALASFEIRSWKSSDGREIEGILTLPPNWKPGERVPLILQIHGGPAGVFTNTWSADAHLYGGLGYATLRPNVRGSSNYGDALLRGNMRDIGGGDFQDLMTGVDFLIEKGIADPERMGVRGWSYGGILGGWTITHTTRFKAASLGAMVSDWTSEYGQGFNFDVGLWYIGGDPWSNPEGYRERSALTHIQNATTPTLIHHGERDTTDTIEQSMNFFNALWEKGVPARFLRFPREPHGLREPRHQRTRLVEDLKWMEKYVRGVEWKDEGPVMDKKEESDKKEAEEATEAETEQ